MIYLKDHGLMPPTLRADNGPEFTCKAIKSWAEKNGVAIANTRKGRLTDNGHIESFNGRLRDECLNQHIFTSLEEARKTIEAGRLDYNEIRPHGALGCLAPAAYRENKTGAGNKLKTGIDNGVWSILLSFAG